MSQQYNTNGQQSELGPILDFLPERAVIGCVLSDPSVLENVTAILQPEHFLSPACKTIFTVLLEMAGSGVKIDLVTLVNHLWTAGHLNTVGGRAALSELEQEAPPPGHALQHARSVREASIKRQIHQRTLEIQKAVSEGRSLDDVMSLCGDLQRFESTADGTGYKGLATLTPASTVRPLKTDWAWNGLIPINALTVLAGNPGLGKSTIALEKAAQWSRGLVDGDFEGCPVDVIISSAEDSPAHTLIPRLTAAGGDLSRIHFIGMPREGSVDSIALPDDVHAIRRAMEQVAAKILIIDPLACHLNQTINSWRDADIRRALSPMAEMAENLGAAVLAIVHLNKGNYSEAQYKISGSTGIVAAARSVLLVAEDPEDESACVLAHLKCNLSPKAISRRYTTVERRIPSEGGDILTSAIVWGDEAPGLTASSVLNAKKDPEELSATEEAMEWLEGHLGGLALAAKQVVAEARKMGIKERTLKRARQALGVQAFKNGFGKDGVWTWQLPAKEAKGGQDATKEGQYHKLGPLSRTPQKKAIFPITYPKGANLQILALLAVRMSRTAPRFPLTYPQNRLRRPLPTYSDYPRNKMVCPHIRFRYRR